MARHQAVILKKLPVREHDELIVCYTRDFGKQRYVAKSSRRAHSKQGSHLDVLNYIEYSIVPGRHTDIITSAASINSFPMLKASLPALANGLFLLACFDKLVYDGERDERLWDFLLARLASPETRATEADIVGVMGHHAGTRFAELSRDTIASWKISL